MLNEAARVSKDPEPNIPTSEIQEIMDPVKFIERHNQKGEPNPKETVRMVNERREHLKEMRKDQLNRR